MLEQIQTQLKQYIVPCLQQDLVSANAITNIDINGKQVNIAIKLGVPVQIYQQQLKNDIVKQLSTITDHVVVDISWQIAAHKGQSNLPLIKGVKNTIVVASGKGGVGKSTTTVNLALALAQQGARVGILDADIYGPNQPAMLGLNDQRPESDDGKTMYPLINHGIQSMSMGYLIEANTPMVWRGPMISGALQQLTYETQWDNLDYLFIDMPPGTGDTQLTLAQKIPVSGAIIVTTPQDIALLDARKGLEMFRKVNVPILGIIENMSLHTCSQCNHQEAIFGHGGGQRIAEQCDTELLGQLPLDIKIRQQADSGKPTVIAEANSEITKIYTTIALRAAAKLSLREKDYSNVFGNIVVE